MASYYSFDSSGEKVHFQKEISNMLHGFGDNPNPNAATVVLVENIVLQQMRSMVQEAFNNSQFRGSNIITNFDIIYLMRKNKLKLKRLHDYQIKLNLATKQAAINSNIMPEIHLEDEKDPTLKGKQSHIDVIKELDETDEVGQIKFDVIDYLRKVRAAKISEAISYEKYEAYHKARCMSFRTSVGNWRRNYSKFEWWINPNKDINIAMSAIEVLSFLAYETVAEIVDAVFLIRQDAKKKNGDPFSKFEGGYFCNPVSLSNAVYIKSGFEGVPAITVSEVREVLRRYFSPCVGMNGLFSRNMSLDLPVKFIAI